MTLVDKQGNAERVSYQNETNAISEEPDLIQRMLTLDSRLRFQLVYFEKSFANF